MSKQTIVTSVVLAGAAAVTVNFIALAKPRMGPVLEKLSTERLTALRPPMADREWIVGTWRSRKLEYGEFGEWKGTVQIELIAHSPKEIDLFLIAADGKRMRASDIGASIMDDRRLFFGPIGSGLLFHYRHAGNELVLDLDASEVRIHAELHRVRR
jgi:hypothetical protein